ncbi:MAG: GldG family protein, partial [Odoribacter sp.]
MVWLICILSENTRNLLKHTDRLIRVDIFLAGNLPAEMQKLQYSLTCMLEEFRRLSGDHFRYEIIDPSEVQDTAEKKALVKYLTDRGIMPVNLNRRTEDETLSQQIIFPGMVVYDKEMEVGINLLQNIPGLSAEQNINHSVEMLEYELTKAIRRLTRKEEKSVAFLTGQGELTYPEVMDMANMLLYYYQVDFVGADSLALDPGRYAALIVAKPTTDFSERDKFIVDQYVMNGGRFLWCVDEVDVEHSLLKNQETIPAVYRPLNIEDLLFRYGVRINPDLLLDGNCVLMTVVTGMNGSTPVYRPGSWYYLPLLVPQTEHSVTSYLLDKTELKANRQYWEFLNLLFPLILVGGVGGIILGRRK